MRVLSLGYVGVETPAAQAWEQFGPDVLGMTVAEPGGDGSVRMRMDDRHHRLSLHPGPRDRLAYLGWELADDGALAEAIDDLMRAGLDVMCPTDEEVADRAVRRFVWFADHLGVRHELFHGHQIVLPTSRPPQPIGGFVTGEQGIGHVALAVPDRREATNFFTRTLGFGLSDEVDGRTKLAFLHCNARHHSLALAEVEGMRGILHLMVQVAELDDVGLAYDQCMSRKIPLHRTLGRHSNDHALSFYVRTPSGFDVEYGWGAIEVDETRSATVFTSGSVWGHHITEASLRPEALETVAVSAAGTR
ncbi:MAG: extradiol dioxygenase [Acidimicrobiaceae bacterium]|jgi:extradiol dioxygenase